MNSQDHAAMNAAKPMNLGQQDNANNDINGIAHKEYTENPRSQARPSYDGRTLAQTPTAQPYRTYEEHGILIDGDQDDADAKADYEHHKHLWWYRVRYTMADAFSEFCGCLILIIFGDGSVAQVLLSANPKLPAGDQNKGNYQSISWGWGIGVMLGMYVDASESFVVVVTNLCDLQIRGR